MDHFNDNHFRKVDRSDCEDCIHFRQRTILAPSCAKHVAFHEDKGGQRHEGFYSNLHAQESICNLFEDKPTEKK